jgi:type I restriction enzyme S subunit
MPLLLPSLEEQEVIGDLFSSIDRKIALNRAINQNLATPDRSSEVAGVRRAA